MAPRPSPSILLTGATGFIGGTVLHSLLTSPTLKSLNPTITCLLRGSDRAAKLTTTYGDRVKTILYDGLDDTEAATAAAAEHDVVVNTTLGYHLPSAQALIRGLALRKASLQGNQEQDGVWYVQTSGTSNVADRPISGKWVESKSKSEGGHELDDLASDVYTYEHDREVREGPYFQRTTELGVVDLGLSLGVKTVVIMSPTIYGVGTGLFNRLSYQVPSNVRAALHHGRPIVAGNGSGVWDHVHVEDLADLYILLVQLMLEKRGEGIPTGKRGILFSGNGRHSWREVAQGVADVLYEEGKIANREVQEASLAEVARVLTESTGQPLTEELVERGFSSNSLTVASVARKLGWKPTRGEDAWKKGFRDDVQAVLEAAK
ncbi:NAD dependent epimerase/dehydratase family protein [Hypoxylon fragiforme]|uniref:NAD dependent epimerase/dehydratase family protein n=1 Tax=Hypoxylon fragiforme TaxID=63214 RepID=UPI0020C60049|nr:NAD dependent epimerase/dehydratase family protein [Hypoxylon fragiforme]KAI2607317.1 NAD dependent epimerase/dehydratase family protein [Hypoxylon fragiforme]